MNATLRLFLQALRYLLQRYAPLAWLRSLLLYGAPLVRWWLPNWMPPAHCQLNAVYRHRANTFSIDHSLTAAYQRQWNANAIAFALEPAQPILVAWRLHGNDHLTYYRHGGTFPPTLVRPRGATLLGGPRNNRYVGERWETPSWLEAELELAAPHLLQNQPTA